MRPTKAILLLGGAICFSLSCFSQKEAAGTRVSFTHTTVNKTDSGIYITTYSRTSCKDLTPNSIFIANPVIDIKAEPVAVAVLPGVKWLTIHGNISYDFFYRSRVDTPLNQQDLQQHTERIALDILVKEQYPLKLNLASRQSNSPFFRNFIDVNFQFDRYAYNKNLKQQLLDKLKTQVPERPDLALLKAAIKEQTVKYENLKNRVHNPATLQKIIEQRERQYNQALNKNSEQQDSATTRVNADSILNGNSKDSLIVKMGRLRNKGDSIENDLAKEYETDKAYLDTLAEKIHRLQQRADSVQNSAQKDIFAARQKVINATSQKELQQIAAANGIQTDTLQKLQKQLAAIKTFSIGRSMLNYTELTAQNIIISGINAEYNPSYYAAFAAGKIDYRFRDFFTRNTKKNDQYLVLGRFGFGDKDRRALIFTYFQGRKNQADFVISDSVQNYVNLMGYSVEAIAKKDENISISAEFAKSTKPVSGNLQTNKQTAALFKLADQSNMGINIKAQTIIPETNTKLSGFFRKTGQSFQSFSLFSYNTDQTAWLAKIDQSFYKKRVSITAMLRQNDFTNPFTEKTYKTTTVFKSLLLNVRLPKYPMLNLGYYPGTQLYYVNKDRIRENAYYIINGSLTYSYFYKRTIGMNTALVYNRYINQATDSGFQLYKGINYYAAQTIFLKKLQLQGGYSYNRQPELEYYTIETSVDYALKKWLRLGAGSKYNKISSGSNYWGERLQLLLDLRTFGQFQFQYEKSYLPAITRSLYTVEIGRISWYKYF